MRFFNRHFFIGCFFGIVLVIGISVLGAYIFMATRPGDPAEGMAAIFSPPAFPSPTQITIYGQVDDAWSVRSLNGKAIDFSKFKNRVVFIHFWATWCRPWCIAELPEIQRLYDSMQNENIVFLVVAWDEDANRLRQFLDKGRFSFPAFLREKELPKILQTAGVPATFILGRDGSVLFRHFGPAKWDDDSTRNFLRGLL